MPKTVAIDCFPESARAYRGDCAIVVVDVIRATTTAVTAVARGRECFPVPSVEAAVALGTRLTNPLLVGELGGNMPYGFELNNSPADLESRTDVDRPMILLSTSGTRLITEAEGAEAVYVACLRNYSAQAACLAAHHDAVAVIGAGARGEFREEDQLCCAWIAEALLNDGFAPANAATVETVERWRGAPVDAITHGNSADYLRRSDQVRDLEFILAHVDDLADVYAMECGRVARRASLARVAVAR
jgi:2-phosphosulfolactate phosphatase